MQFAGFWRRFFAVLIDQLIIVYVSYVVGSTIETAVNATYQKAITSRPVMYLLAFLIPVLWALLSFVYFALLEGKLGTTAGKRLLNLKIVKEDEPNRDGIGVVPAALRTLINALLSVVLNISFYLSLLDRSRRALHDRIMGTLVVHDPTGRFGSFDPDRLLKREKRATWFVVLLIITALFAFIQFVQAPA